jgi:hypothetical protein
VRLRGHEVEEVIADLLFSEAAGRCVEVVGELSDRSQVGAPWVRSGSAARCEIELVEGQGGDGTACLG